MPKMPLQLIRVNTVAIGSFNIHIIQPRWLVAERIIESNQEIELKANLEEPGFRLSFPDKNMTWIVHPSRLIIESNDTREGRAQNRIYINETEALEKAPAFLCAPGKSYMQRSPSRDNIREVQAGC